MSNAAIGRDVRAALTHFMVRVLDPVARMLWVTLVAEQDDLVSEGVLRGGSKHSFCRLFSRWFLFDENQVLNSVETLLETGLLTQRSDGSLLMAPLAGTRHGAGRPRNLGGRPRKGETAAEAYARKQREEEQLRQQRRMRLMAVIPGGLEGAVENPAETQDETAPRERVAAASLSEERKQQQPREDAAAVSRLAAEVAQESGVALATIDESVLRSWMDLGATPGLVLQVVRSVSARANYVAPKSVGYFTPAVREAVGAGVRPEAAASAARSFSPDDIEAFNGLMEWCQTGRLRGNPTHPGRLSDAERQEQLERWRVVLASAAGRGAGRSAAA